MTARRLALALAVSEAAAEDCLAEHAVYRMRGDNAGISARFEVFDRGAEWPELGLSVTTEQRRYRFTFTMSQGYGGTLLVPITGPLEDAEEPPPEVTERLRFYALDKDLDVQELPPEQGDPAPRHLFMPELGNVLWYAPKWLTEDPEAERDPIPRGMFSLASCER